MLVRITPDAENDKPNYVLLARHLRVSCYMSIADAKHIVNHALSNGSAIIPIGMMQEIKIEELISVAEQAGFKAVKVP